MKRFLLLLLSVIAAMASAPPGAAQGYDRPGREDGPTILHVRMVALNVNEVSSAKQTFTANVFVMVRWQDDRLAHEGPGNKVIPSDAAWAPDFQFVNQHRLIPTFPEQLVVRPDGEVLYRQRVWGPFSQPMDLSEFPFDRQRFEVQLAASLPPTETPGIVLVQDDLLPSGLAPEFSLPDWDIREWEAVPWEYDPLDTGKPIYGFLLALEADRHAGYYVLKIVLPLLLIVMMSWIVFWIDPKEMSPQVSVSVTSMLTLIAYRFMVGRSLPAVSYLTRMDRFILCASLLVFATLVEVVTTGVMARRGHVKAARRVDRVARVVFPTALIAVAILALKL